MTKVRSAGIDDAKFINGILKKYSIESDLVVKNLSDIYAQLRDYKVLEIDGIQAGLIALHVYWEDLAEIRSFIVDEKYRGKSSGKKLFDAAVKEAAELGIKKVFVLTKIAGYFKKLGFRKIQSKQLPQKIWKDCLNCPKFPDCDEIAMIKNIDTANAKKKK